MLQGRKLQRWQSSGSGIAGLNDGEMEVMRLREENEALMDSLVRTKVELAETEGNLLAWLPFLQLIVLSACRLFLLGLPWWAPSGSCGLLCLWKLLAAQ